jgi:hypothetical protein
MIDRTTTAEQPTAAEREASAVERLVMLHKPKPRAFYNHYSNPASQGALICQTGGYPNRCDRDKLHVAYSDRIAGWNYDRFKEACEIAGTGDQGWAEALPNLTNARLKEFAQVALNLPELPVHVRAVHHFNVATGYSCPTIEAITA